MPNCKKHEDCDLVCPWDGYYCSNKSHEWHWRHVRDLNHGHLAPRQYMGQDDMPDDIEAYRNERAEEMP